MRLGVNLVPPAYEYDPVRGEHTTRDVAARIYDQIRAGKDVKGGVRLDLTALSLEDWVRSNPRPSKHFLEHGLDFREEEMIIAPEAHFFMGGAVIDDQGQTRVPGLFAVGEACTGRTGYAGGGPDCFGGHAMHPGAGPKPPQRRPIARFEFHTAGASLHPVATSGQSRRGISRRDFLGGAAAGLTGVAFGPLLAACGNPSAGPAAPSGGGPHRGGALKVALDSDIIGIDPQGASAGVDRNVYTSIYNALVTVDGKLNIVPDLAESWTAPDPSTYVFKLRPKVKFHDGSPFDAEAVKFNFDWILDPANASARRAELADIQSVTVMDPLTVKVTTKTPFAPFLSIIADRAGYIISPAARKKFGKDLSRNPVGTGPFRFVEWVKDDHVTFRRNPDYHESGLPLLDEVTYKPVPDASVRVTGLKSGETHFLYRIDPKDIASVRSSGDLEVLEGPGVAFTGLWLNTSTGPLANRDLREARAWAVDRDAILKAAYFGIGQVAHGPVPPSLFPYDASFKPFQHDVGKAKAALARGGQAGGFKMVLKSPNESVASKVSQLVQAQAKSAGIDIEIQTLEFGALLKAGEQGAFDAMTLGWSGRVDPDGNIQPIFHTKGTFNYGRYKGADDLIDEARRTLDKPKRTDLYRQIQKKVARDDLAYVFTYFAPTVYAASKRVKDFPVSPDNLMRFKRAWLSQ